MYQLFFDPYTSALYVGVVGSTSTSDNPTQINQQSLSQNWLLSEGFLRVTDSITLNSYTLEVSSNAKLEIN